MENQMTSMFFTMTNIFGTPVNKAFGFVCSFIVKNTKKNGFFSGNGKNNNGVHKGRLLCDLNFV